MRHVGRGTFTFGQSSARGASDDESARSAGCSDTVTPAEGAGPWARRTSSADGCRASVLGHSPQQLVVPVEPSVELSGRRLSADRLRRLRRAGPLRPASVGGPAGGPAREHLPLVMVGNRTGGCVPRPYWWTTPQGAFELCQHLIHLGHREIRLCVDPAMMPAAAGGDGLPSGHGAKRPVPPSCVRDRPPLTRVWPWRRSGAVGRPPSICVGSNAAALVARGRTRRLARPLSLCCIPEPCDAARGAATITGYDVNADHLAHVDRRAARVRVSDVMAAGGDRAWGDCRPRVCAPVASPDPAQPTSRSPASPNSSSQRAPTAGSTRTSSGRDPSSSAGIDRTRWASPGSC